MAKVVDLDQWRREWKWAQCLLAMIETIRRKSEHATLEELRAGEDMLQFIKNEMVHWR
jgi:hypothetical protein